MIPVAYHGIYPTLKCNFSCECCCRDENESASGLQLSYLQIRQSLEETQCFCDEYQVHKVFTGGEPTLWKDGDKGITDLLVDSAQLGFHPHLITNGSAFDSKDATELFLDDYFSRTETSLEITVSADCWHENVNSEGRCAALDHLLDFRTWHGLKPEKLSVASEWTCSSLKEHLPTDQFLNRYQGQVDAIVCLPIALCGTGQNLASIVPKLSPSGSCKASLGAFLDVIKQRACSRGWIDNHKSFSELTNSIIMNECYAGKGNLCLYADGSYYTCADGIGNPLFRICSLGEMSLVTVAEFFSKNPASRQICELGPLGFLRQLKADPTLISEITNAVYPFGISGRGGCAIHQKLIEVGLLQ